MLAKINWRPGHAEIKYFANTLIVLAIVFAGILLLMGKAKPALFVGVGGLVLAIACRIAPLVGRWTYLLWTAVSFALSMLVSPIVIGVIFYLVLTPIALIARISGKDELHGGEEPFIEFRELVGEVLADAVANADAASF